MNLSRNLKPEFYKQWIINTSTEMIDRTIDSMWNRIEDVIKGIGNRTKY